MRVGGEVLLTPAGATGAVIGWDTDHYLVAYVDPNSGAGDLTTVRLAPDGTALGSPVVVETTPGVSGQPSLVKTTKGWLLAWTETSTTQTSVRAAALDAMGAVSGSVVEMAKSASSDARPVVASLSTGLEGAWTDVTTASTVLFAPLGGTGAVTSPPSGVGLITADAKFPWLASGASGDVLVWSDKRDGQLDVRLRNLAAGTSEIQLRQGQTGDASLPRATALSKGFAVVWEDTRSGDDVVYAAWTDAAGNKLGETVVPLSVESSNWPHLVVVPKGEAVVYYQFVSGHPQIVVSLLDGAFAHVGGDTQISESTGKARFPEVASTGSELGIIWIDTRSGMTQAYFARVACP